MADNDSRNRYIIRGFIDGVLSSLGVVIGASAAIGFGDNDTAALIIIAAGIGGGIANGLSNILGAFVGEKLVKEKNLRKIENAMLKKEGLRGTELDRRMEKEVRICGVYDGLSTIFGSLIPVAPFLLGLIISCDSTFLLYVSAAISLILFFILGLYVGKISRENIILSGLKLVAFGMVTLIVTFLVKIFFSGL
jgi:predicted membrane protein (TIGR00267 family)